MNLIDSLHKQYPPLPKEILNLSAHETACHYCGVSYLILSEMEKMKEQVKQMETELQELSCFKNERPQLMEMMDALNKKVVDYKEQLNVNSIWKSEFEQQLQRTQLELEASQKLNASLIQKLVKLG